MTRNPLAYGLSYAQLLSDPDLEGHKRGLIIEAAKQLKAAQVNHIFICFWSCGVTCV